MAIHTPYLGHIKFDGTWSGYGLEPARILRSRGRKYLQRQVKTAGFAVIVLTVKIRKKCL